MNSLVDRVLWSSKAYKLKTLTEGRFTYPILIKAESGVHDSSNDVNDISLGQVLLVQNADVQHVIARNAKGLFTRISSECNYTYEIYHADGTCLGLYSLPEILNVFPLPVLAKFDPKKPFEFYVNGDLCKSKDIDVFELVHPKSKYMKVNVVDDEGLMYRDQFLPMNLNVDFFVGKTLDGYTVPEFRKKLQKLYLQTVHVKMETIKRPRLVTHQPSGKLQCMVQPFNEAPERLPFENTLYKKYGASSSATALAVDSLSEYPANDLLYENLNPDDIYDNSHQYLQMKSSDSKDSTWSGSAAGDTPNYRPTELSRLRISDSVDTATRTIPSNNSPGASSYPSTAADGIAKCFQELDCAKVNPKGKYFRDTAASNLPQRSKQDEPQSSRPKKQLNSSWQVPTSPIQSPMSPPGLPGSPMSPPMSPPGPPGLLQGRPSQMRLPNAQQKRSTSTLQQPPSQANLRKTSLAPPLESPPRPKDNYRSSDLTTHSPAPTALQQTGCVTYKIHNLRMVPQDISELNMLEVSDCLVLLKLEKFVDAFATEQMNGLLLKNCTKCDLMESFGMSAVAANKLILFAQGKFKPS